MGKYDPLSRYLSQQDVRFLTLTFDEIETILGASLPLSAKTGRQWWWSDTDPRSTNVQSRAWTKGGYITHEIDFFHRRVTFEKGRPIRKWQRGHRRSIVSETRCPEREVA